jgi:ornithine carbamoyltransferase
MPRHFVDIFDHSSDILKSILQEAKERKNNRPAGGKIVPDFDEPLKGKIIGLIFTKPSTRTRISFEVAMRQLGGDTIMLTGAEMQLGRGETIADTARVLSRFVDGVMIRTFSHDDVCELAEHSDIPIINGLTDLTHPCQIMADIMTYQEKRGDITGKKVAWIGDGNNVCHSWIEAAIKLNFTLHIACPDQLKPKAQFIQKAIDAGADIVVSNNIFSTAEGADIVTTDTWVSMGDEDLMRRHKLLKPFQVNADIMKLASNNALFMHCLPAHREEEVSSEVFDSVQSVVFDEAENRLHAQKGILSWCLK